MESIRAWWLRNDIEEWLLTTAVAITIASLMYFFFWGVHFALAWGVGVTGLTWVLRGIVFAAFSATGYMLWNEYKKYKADPVNYPYGPPQAGDDDEHSSL